MKEVILFLDYEIIRTKVDQMVPDVWVLRKADLDKPTTSFKDLWECHLGAYPSVRLAMESAVTYFMIKRSEIFHAQIHHRTLGTKTSHEWFLFNDVVRAEGIPMPDELTHDAGYTIVFKDEPHTTCPPTAKKVAVKGVWKYNENKEPK